jgi:peptidyl-prolyl cis-trans isomerase A (cyclophilin A)
MRSHTLPVLAAFTLFAAACATSNAVNPQTAAPVTGETENNPESATIPPPAASSPAPTSTETAAAAAGGAEHAVYAKLDTPKGLLTCRLFDDRAPNTVANFVGLAEGTKRWKDWTGQWVTRPAYDGTTFHRIIKGFMIQGGDANGGHLGRPGTGEPGYVIDDEIWKGAMHDRAGLMCMANRGPNTNGMQFFITDAPAPNLDGGYTIFGECSPVDVVHQLADWPVNGDKAINPPVIAHVTIERH